MGADESEERGAPVGTVRVEGLGAGSESINADCADSGREGGIVLLRAAMASFRAERLAPGPAALFVGVEDALEALGFEASFSSSVRDLASRAAMMALARSGQTP